LLTSYKGGAITYDAIGNPLTYRGYTLDWTGRKLSKLIKGTETIEYTYDANGLRASKTVKETATGTVKSVTTYQYVGDQLVYEKRGDMHIYYMYDVAGCLSGIRYIVNGVQSDYYVVCNSRGDVEAFYNGAGELKARYIYDAWGNVINIIDANGNEITNQNNVGHINPIRYRGYYYDEETNLYYLQSRYYDAEVGRFISVDGFVSTGQGIVGTNMFAYCYNDPVNMVDINGCDPVPTWAIRINNGTATWEDYEKALTANAGAWAGSARYKVDAAIAMAKGRTVDVTKKLDNTMRENSVEVKQYKEQHGFVKTLEYFYEQVDYGGTWDLKSQADWALDESMIYVYQDTILRFDDIGNIHYGYIGRELFCEEILLIGGGYAQVKKWGIEATIGNWRTFLDDPRDQWAIRYGCKLWDAEAST